MNVMKLSIAIVDLVTVLVGCTVEWLPMLILSYVMLWYRWLYRVEYWTVIKIESMTVISILGYGSSSHLTGED